LQGAGAYCGGLAHSLLDFGTIYLLSLSRRDAIQYMDGWMELQNTALDVHGCACMAVSDCMFGFSEVDFVTFICTTWT